jgi:signal recognition particle subunit SEC65
MRAVYLTSLQEFDKDTQHNEGRKAASKKGVANQLKDIKQALEDRGFDKDELFEHLQRRVK